MEHDNNGTVKPTDLTVEQLHEPLGVGGRPRFSYKVEDAANGAVQESVRIRVYSSRELLEAGDADMWDCTMETNGMSMIEYDGATLEDVHRYFWTVEIRDSLGNTGISQAASFVTGIIDGGWKAGFMGPEAFSYAQNRAVYCRADFRVRAGLKNAYALVCGLGYHVFSINGRKQGDAVLEPGFTTFDKRVQYVMHDISAALNEGVNTLGVVLGEGWYNNRHEVFDRFEFLKPLSWLGLPKVSYQIYLRYEDGSQEVLLSGPDSGLTVGSGPIVYNNVFNGEHYDARLERAWDMPGGGEGFKPAIEVDAPCSIIEAELAEPIKVVRTIMPVSVSCPAEGVCVYDFGQNFAGWVRIETDAACGTRIDLRFAEMLYPDGTVNQENLRWAKNNDVYICRGGQQSWEPSFTYHGFRYVQLEGCGPESIKLTGCVVRSALPRGGDFHCSDELLNKIQRCVVWTEESNLHSVPTDCPQRDERQGWVNDCTVRIEELIYNFSAGAFLRKWMKDLADTQDEDGSIKDVAPRVFGADKADPLSSVFLFVPWFNYMFGGDIKIIGDYYEALKAWEQYLISRSHFGIMDYYNYGDWAGPVDGGVGGAEANSALSAITPGQFVATVFFYENARLLARMARLLDKPDEAEKYSQLADYIRVSINREYFNPETAQYALGSQASNLLALHFDIVPEEKRQAVLANLVEDIKAHDYHLTTGNIATKYLFEVLSDNGLCDVAYAIATKEDYPSWGYMFSKGATTIWERWELGTTSAMNSHNHPMYGTISTWFYKHLAGIRPLSPAFERVLIAPKPAQKLEHASAWVETPRGRVSSAWRRTESGLHMSIVLPLGTTAEIVLPEGFKPDGDSCGGLKAEDGRITVCSGRYELELTAE